MEQMARVVAISWKDVESYYGKPPLITWGLMFPAVLIVAAYLIKGPGTYAAIAPGLIAMTLLFGNTSMAAIVITFEKRTGALQRLLIAPVSHATIVLGKMLSAALYGVVTSLLLTVGLVFLVGLRIPHPALFIAGIALGAVTFSLLGLLASVLVREVFEAMTLMNFFRFPLLFVSGVFVPVEHFPSYLKPVPLASPLTYIVELLRHGLSVGAYFGSPAIPIIAGVIWAAGSWYLCVWAFCRRAAA